MRSDWAAMVESTGFDAGFFDPGVGSLELKSPGSGGWAALDADLLSERWPGQASRDLRDRLQTLPAHIPAQRTSPEPNGQ